ncbi:hypothetical protein [Halobaculum sp. EA56]|uniref:hypothetical protein n=1 Tax=Halobaculum sp. EA56 TaxID=3421648 RepID=UPI003EBE922D
MLTRRQLIAGIGSAFISAGVVSSAAAFSATSSAASASFTVVYPDLIELRAANDPPVHVETTDGGRVTAITPGGEEEGVNQHAITRFEDIIEVVNAGTMDLDGIYFAFEAESDTLGSEVLSDIEAALAVTAGSEPLDGSGESSDDLLAVSPHPNVADGVLSPGESIPFGIRVDLVPEHGTSQLSDLPDRDYEVTLRVTVNTRKE